jgi:hypothetical protein
MQSSLTLSPILTLSPSFQVSFAIVLKSERKLSVGKR